MATLVISYSRVDRPQVTAVVTLLKAALRGVDNAVFWDDDFEPGELWFDQICRHIDATSQLFVFWCEHAAHSQQVRRELAYALQQGKRVVPVLMDNTQLVPELAPIHGIDLRGAVQHTPLPDEEIVLHDAPTLASSASKWLGIALLAVFLVPLVLIALAVWSAPLGAPALPDGLPNVGAPVEPPPQMPAPAAPATQLTVLLLVLMAGAILSLMVSRLRTRRPAESPRAFPAPVALDPWVDQQHIITAFEPFISDTNGVST